MERHCVAGRPPASRGARRTFLFLAFHRLAMLVLAMLPAEASSQTLRDAIVPGRLTERIVSPSDTLRSYALYIPTSFDSSRTWPVLMLMDPRGRATIPLERVKPAAERFGWILMSSYDTRSDDPDAKNVEAANAMLADAQAALHPDTKRFYFAGFSGTARLAWDFAASLEGAIAGIIASGAGLQQKPEWLLTPGFPKLAFFGTAGYTGFNYDEVRALEPWLEQAGLAWRTRYFEGGHEWMPDTLFAEAVAWLELEAMRDSLETVRASFVDSMFTTANVRAVRAPDAMTAWQRDREIVRDFRGLRDTHDAAARADSIAGTDDWKRRLELRNDVAADAKRYDVVLALFLRDLANSAQPPSVAYAMSRLEIEKLKKEATKSDDPERANAAKRRLESTFVSASFYTPNAALAGGRPAFALLMLDVAERIHPDRPNVQLGRARALTALDRRKEAVEALRKAMRDGVGVHAIATDSSFLPLRDFPAFRELIGETGR
jgi:predicted esterase